MPSCTQATEIETYGDTPKKLKAEWAKGPATETRHAEFIAYAKAKPGKVNMAALTGATDHMAAALLKIMAGIDFVHVPYRGVAPALTDLMAGQVQLMIPAMTASLEHFRAGRLRALATKGPRFEPMLADVNHDNDRFSEFNKSGTSTSELLRSIY